MSTETLSVDAELQKLERESFGYFLRETNPQRTRIVPAYSGVNVPLGR